MDDRRVHIYFENALKFIRRCEDEYDLIIVDSTDPFGPSEGLFTREFYGSCYNALQAKTASWSTSRAARSTRRTPAPCSAATSASLHTFPISRVYQAHIPTYAAGLLAVWLCQQKIPPD